MMKPERLLRDMLALDGSAEKITTLSSYIQLNDAKACAKVWMTALEKCDPSRALPLMYLANDVLQRSRAKTQDFVQEFARYLPAAFAGVGARAPSQLERLQRLAGIWVERQVYTASFMKRCESAALEGSASGAAKAAPPSADAQPTPADARPARSSNSSSRRSGSSSSGGGGGGGDALGLGLAEEEGTGGEEAVVEGEAFAFLSGASNGAWSGSSPSAPQASSSSSSGAATSASASSVQDACVDAIIAGSALEAIAEAKSRAQALALAWDRFSAIPTSFGEARAVEALLQASSSSGGSDASSAAADALAKVSGAERIARLAHAALRLDSRRRAALVARLSLALTELVGREGEVDEELAKAEEVERALERLSTEGGGGGGVRLEKTGVARLLGKRTALMGGGGGGGGKGGEGGEEKAASGVSGAPPGGVGASKAPPGGVEAAAASELDLFADLMADDGADNFFTGVASTVSSSSSSSSSAEAAASAPAKGEGGGDRGGEAGSSEQEGGRGAKRARERAVEKEQMEEDEDAEEERRATEKASKLLAEIEEERGSRKRWDPLRRMYVDEEAADSNWWRDN